MDAPDVFPRLNDAGPMMLCKRLSDRAPEIKRLFRVPIEHRRLGALTYESRRLLDELPDLPSFDQLRAVLAEGSLGLFAPARGRHDTTASGSNEDQESLGAIILLPPVDWHDANAEFAQMQFDGVEAAFEGLHYSFDDIVVFAKLNFSPDCWFIVRRGPMAGNVFWWTHDGDSQMEEPWAEDIRDWGRRVWD